MKRATDGLLWVFCLKAVIFIRLKVASERSKKLRNLFNKYKDNSDGKAPFFESEGWFYEQVLTQVYGTLEEVAYKGRGLKPLPKQAASP